VKTRVSEYRAINKGSNHKKIWPIDQTYIFTLVAEITQQPTCICEVPFYKAAFICSSVVRYLIRLKETYLIEEPTVHQFLLGFRFSETSTKNYLPFFDSVRRHNIQICALNKLFGHVCRSSAPRKHSDIR